MLKKIIEKILLAFGILKKVPGETPKVELPAPAESHPSFQAAKSVKLGIIVGHEKNSQGAEFYQKPYTEYKYNTEIARLMESNAPRTIKPIVIFRDGVGIAGAYQKAFAENCDCVIELHCNAFNGKARGTLVYTSNAAEDVAFSKEIQKVMVAVFGTEGRRVDEDYGRGIQVIGASDRGGRNVYSFNGLANCLVEPAFCDEQKDCFLLLNKKEEYAKGLLTGVEIWAKKQGLI